MTLPLTPEMLRTAYEFLCTTPPFDKWNFPDSDDLVFKVSSDKSHYAWLTTKRRKRPVLAVSAVNIGHTHSLIESVAHEMGHLHQHLTGMPLTHGAGWRKIREEICKYHGFDPKKFG